MSVVLLAYSLLNLYQKTLCQLQMPWPKPHLHDLTKNEEVRRKQFQAASERPLLQSRRSPLIPIFFMTHHVMPIIYHVMLAPYLTFLTHNLKHCCSASLQTHIIYLLGQIAL